MAGVGVCASSLTRSQITAFIVAIAVLFLLVLVGLDPLLVVVPCEYDGQYAVQELRRGGAGRVRVAGEHGPLVERNEPEGAPVTGLRSGGGLRPEFGQVSSGLSAAG